MQPELETRGTQTDTGWRDHDGFVGPIQPGNGPRSDPRGAFPTGPEVGQPMPEVNTRLADGSRLDLHAHRNGAPAVFIFYRSAVW
ncbi:MAG: hypothetical protein AAF529_03445 [Pseudomonadota bacterium]